MQASIFDFPDTEGTLIFNRDSFPRRAAEGNEGSFRYASKYLSPRRHSDIFTSNALERNEKFPNFIREV